MSNCCLADTESVGSTMCGKATRCFTTTKTLPAEFTPFSLAWADAYRPLFASMPARPLAFSLPNLWAWADYMKLEICFAHGLAWMRCRRRGLSYLGPVGAWDQTDWQALLPRLQDMGTVHQVPEPLALIWQQAFGPGLEITENRDSWEYVYHTENLATLAGNRYHTQRNHVNAYVREHGEPDIRDMGRAQGDAMLALATRWHDHHGTSDMVEAELDSLKRTIECWDCLDLAGKGVYLNDELVAFGIGHALDSETMAVMYEKAEPGLRGAFPVMTRSFARTAAEGFLFLNRAEDMGEPGMRQAKMQYRPVDFQKMCSVRF